MSTTQTPSTARVSFRQPVSTTGHIDAAWWPRSHDLRAELPALLDVLWTADRDITRVTYNLAAWDPAPRRVKIDGRIVRLGGFGSSDKHTVRLSDAWRREVVDIVVVDPDTAPDEADRIFALASTSGNPGNAEQILARP